MNEILRQRLAGIQQMLIGAYRAGGGMSSATRGRERELFVDRFLSAVLPTPCRVGTGDVIDSFGEHTGQLDVVVEYPLVPSLPLPSGTARLYLAEGTAAVVEVKSDLAAQWDDAEAAARKVEVIRRNWGPGIIWGQPPPDHIPYFAVGYTGWKTYDSAKVHLDSSSMAGLLIIESGVFVSSQDYFGIGAQDEPESLWGLIACLQRATRLLTSAGVAVPLNYAR
jgi:hypothetical protein